MSEKVNNPKEVDFCHKVTNTKIIWDYLDGLYEKCSTRKTL